MTIEQKIALANETRLLCAAVAGTDMCVKGGGFACLCNSCTAQMTWALKNVGRMLDEILEEEKIAGIREKCVAANPERNWGEAIGLTGQERPCASIIRLSDVLLAIGDDGSKENGLLFGNLCLIWNLRNDDLTAHSPECVDFLFELFANPQP